MDRISATSAIIVGLLVVLIVGAMGGLGVGIPYKRDALKAAADLATSLFVVALFFERALAVINDLLFGKEQQLADAAFFTSGDGTKLAEVNSKKEATRLAVGFLFGLLVSGAGPRTLEALLDLPPLASASPKLSDSHRTLFFGVDIVLTAGLLAGGSNGLAAIIEIIKKRLQSFYWNLMESLRTKPPRSSDARRGLVPHLAGRVRAMLPFDFSVKVADGGPLPVMEPDFVFSVTGASVARVTADGIHCGEDAILQLIQSVNTIELDVVNKAQAKVTAWYLTAGGLQASPPETLRDGPQTVRFDLAGIVLIRFSSNGELYLHTVR
jgi:hypothetical protein